MRRSVVIVIALGLVAAIATAVLMGVWRVRLRPPVERSKAPENVEIVVAARALEPKTRLDADDVVVRVVPREEAPPGFVSSSVRVIGKALSTRLVKGEALLDTHLSTAHVRIDELLSDGKLAVSITLTSRQGLENLLYPGCLVDVIASFRVSSEGQGTREAISMVLLRALQVLAVNDSSIVSAPKPDEKGGDTKASLGRNLNVTLKVDAQQAEALQLAQEHGTLSLALRSPAKPTSPESTPDKALLLSSLSEDLAKLLRIRGKDAPWGNEPQTAEPRVAAPSTAAAPAVASPPPAAEPAARPWVTLIYRGAKVIEQRFDDGGQPLRSDGGSSALPEHK